MEPLYPTRRAAYTGPEIDEQVSKAAARRIIDQLERQGVDVTSARRDLEQLSQLYNIYMAPGMTGPSVTYATA